MAVEAWPRDLGPASLAGQGGIQPIGAGEAQMAFDDRPGLRVPERSRWRMRRASISSFGSPETSFIASGYSRDTRLTSVRLASGRASVADRLLKQQWEMEPAVDQVDPKAACRVAEADAADAERTNVGR